MKIDKVNVFGTTVPVIHRDGLIDAGGMYGCYSPEQKAIYIDKSLTKRHMKQKYLHVLIHELFHATSHILSWNQGQLSSDMEEIQADNFSKVLLEVFDFRKKHNQ